MTAGQGIEQRLAQGVVFFFSSNRRHTRLTCDWSSDVCSSDLGLKTLEDVLSFLKEIVAQPREQAIQKVTLANMAELTQGLSELADRLEEPTLIISTIVDLKRDRKSDV